MATLSVPLTADLEEFIQSMIDDNKAETKAEVVRMSLRKAREDKFFADLREARQEIADGKGLVGDPREILKHFS